MSLPGFPQEISDQIIVRHLLQGPNKANDLIQYRLVCKAFNRCILDEMISQYSETSFRTLLGNNPREFPNPFKLHGGTILGRKVLRTGKQEYPALWFIQRAVTYLLHWHKGSGIENDRSKATYQVCEAVMAVSPELLAKCLNDTGNTYTRVQSSTMQKLVPVIAVAINSQSLLKMSVKTPADLLSTSLELFPNALEAAVASGKTEALCWMLSFLQFNVKRKPETETWGDMRAAARKIGHALQVAIRLHKNAAAKLIFEFLDKDCVIRDSTPIYLGSDLIKDSITYENKSLLDGAIAFRREGGYNPADYGKLQIIEEVATFIFKGGHLDALCALINSGFLDPNNSTELASPLYLAFKQTPRDHRYEVTRTLLDNGADPNAIVDGKPILYHAVCGGYYDVVKILLEYGASPSNCNKDLCFLEDAERGGWSKCLFLLKKVVRHGMEYVKRPDIWDVYEAERYRDRDRR